MKQNGDRNEKIIHEFTPFNCQTRHNHTVSIYVALYYTRLNADIFTSCLAFFAFVFIRETHDQLV